MLTILGAAVAASLMLSSTAAAAPPPTLGGEALAEHTVWVGNAPACATAYSSFCADGVATGPYPGAFHEQGTFVSGPSTDPNANPYQDYGNLTSYGVKFTLVSSVGQVSGTEMMSYGGWQWSGGKGGGDLTESVVTDYSAVITSPDGSTWSDLGTTWSNLDQSYVGEPYQAGVDLSDVFTDSGNQVTMLTPPPLTSPQPPPLTSPQPPPQAPPPQQTQAPPPEKMTPFVARLPSQLSKRTILRQSGYTLALSAPQAGRIVAVARYHMRAIVAHGRASIDAGSTAVKLRLTAVGRHLLRRKKSLWLIIKAVYTPSGGASVTVERVVRLRS